LGFRILIRALVVISSCGWTDSFLTGRPNGRRWKGPLWSWQGRVIPGPPRQGQPTICRGRAVDRPKPAVPGRDLPLSFGHWKQCIHALPRLGERRLSGSGCSDAVLRRSRTWNYAHGRRHHRQGPPPRDMAPKGGLKARRDRPVVRRAGHDYQNSWRSLMHSAILRALRAFCQDSASDHGGGVPPAH